MKSLKETLVGLLCIAMLTLSITGCQKPAPEPVPEPEPEPETVFEFDQSSLTFSCDAGQKYLKLKATCSWVLDDEIVKVPSWIDLVTPREGEGNNTITIGVMANPYSKERKADVWFTNDESETIKVEVIQEKNPAGIADYKHLGSGYNASGEYAYDGDVMAKVLDIDRLLANEYVADVKSLNTTDERYIYGKTMKEYQENLTQSASISGSYSGFSASVSNSFSKETLSSAENEFATFRHITKKQSFTLYGHLGAEELKDCVLESAMNEIDNMEPMKLFAKYGTHVVTGFVLGGSLDFAMSADVSTASTAVDWSLAASAGFQYMSAGAEASAGYGEYNKMRSEAANFESTLKARGGESQYTSNNPNASESTYSSWLSSLEDPAKWVMVDFDGTKLIPIWDFASTEERKAALEAAALEYLTAPDILVETSHRKLSVKVHSMNCTEDDSGDTAEMKYWWKMSYDGNSVTEFGYWSGDISDSGSWKNIEGQNKIKTVEHLSIYKPHTLKVSMNWEEDDSSSGNETGSGSYTLVYDNKDKIWRHKNESGDEIKSGDQFTINANGANTKIIFKWEK